MAGYSEELIGEWVGNYSSTRKIHKVESVINEELITNCGRRLGTWGWEPIAFPVSNMLCKQCAGAVS